MHWSDAEKPCDDAAGHCSDEVVHFAHAAMQCDGEAVLCLCDAMRWDGGAVHRFPGRYTWDGDENTISRVKKHVSPVAICASRDVGTHFPGPKTRFPVSRNALPGFRDAFPAFENTFPGLRNHGKMSLDNGKMSLNTFPDYRCNSVLPGKLVLARVLDLAAIEAVRFAGQRARVTPRAPAYSYAQAS
jgi:hypothetical protein